MDPSRMTPAQLKEAEAVCMKVAQDMRTNASPEVGKFFEQVEQSLGLKCLTAVHDHPINNVHWDRSYPGGLIQWDRQGHTPSFTASDNLPSLSAPPDAVVLEYVAPTELSLETGNQSYSHVEPLIPASDMMLLGPENPIFPAEPTVWIPFHRSVRCEYFATPYHRGRMLSTNELDPANVAGDRVTGNSAAEFGRGPLFPNASHGTIYFGSVISYHPPIERDGEIVRGPLTNGVVALTFVRLTRKCGREYWSRTANHPAAALDNLPPLGPSPKVLVVPISMEKGESPKVSGEMSDIPARCITKVWTDDELQKFVKFRPSKVKHRVTMDAKDVEVPDPAYPTLFRAIVLNGTIKQTVIQWISSLSPEISSNTTLNFLGEMTARAGIPFPIDALMNARAVVNCASSMIQLGSQQEVKGDENLEEESDPSYSGKAKAAASTGGRSKGGRGKKSPSVSPTDDDDGDDPSAKGSKPPTDNPPPPPPPKRSPPPPPSEKDKPPSGGSDKGGSQRKGGKDPNTTNWGFTPSDATWNLFVELSQLDGVENITPFAGLVMNNLRGFMNRQQVMVRGLKYAHFKSKWAATQSEVYALMAKEDPHLMYYLHYQSGIGTRTEEMMGDFVDQSWRTNGTRLSTSPNGKTFPSRSEDRFFAWTFTEGKRPPARYGSVWHQYETNEWASQEGDLEIRSPPARTAKEAALKRAAKAAAANAAAASAKSTDVAAADAPTPSAAPVQRQSRRKSARSAEQEDLQKAIEASLQPTKRQRTTTRSAATTLSGSKRGRESTPVVTKEEEEGDEEEEEDHDDSEEEDFPPPPKPKKARIVHQQEAAKPLAVKKEIKIEPQEEGDEEEDPPKGHPKRGDRLRAAPKGKHVIGIKDEDMEKEDVGSRWKKKQTGRRSAVQTKEESAAESEPEDVAPSVRPSRSKSPPSTSEPPSATPVAQTSTVDSQRMANLEAQMKAMQQLLLQQTEKQIQQTAAQAGISLSEQTTKTEPPPAALPLQTPIPSSLPPQGHRVSSHRVTLEELDENGNVISRLPQPISMLSPALPASNPSLSTPGVPHIQSMLQSVAHLAANQVMQDAMPLMIQNMFRPPVDPFTALYSMHRRQFNSPADDPTSTSFGGSTYGGMNFGIQTPLYQQSSQQQLSTQQQSPRLLLSHEQQPSQQQLSTQQQFQQFQLFLEQQQQQQSATRGPRGPPATG
jgi:hypothetical protein